MYKEISELVDAAQKILIIQADNPDGDSLGSALALEEILGEQGKDTYLYCAVDMPSYLHFLEGWSRVSSELPSNFDLSIIVDCSTETLLEKLEQTGKKSLVESRPCIVLDHHKEVENKIPYAEVTVNKPELSSTGELVFEIATELSWPLNVSANEAILSAILGDTQGLMNDHAKPSTYRNVATILENGVSRTLLEEKRRQNSKMHPEIFKYKAQLIDRTEILVDGKLAIVEVPYEEITKFSPLYNPAALIQFDMLQTQDVLVAVVLKYYDDGKVTGSIRCNYGAPIGGRLAKHMGGGGHDLASGFKVNDAVNKHPNIKEDVIKQAVKLLGELN